MAGLTSTTIAGSYERLLILPAGGLNGTTLVATTDGDSDTTSALSVATTSISVGATNRIYLDAGGNTYLYESAADEVTLACGGELIRLGDATGTGENTIYGIGAGLTIDANSDANVFIGANVADATLSGADNNVGVGHNALSALTTGSNNVAIGKGASILLTTANKTIFIGEESGDAVTTTGGSNVSDGTVGIGYQSLTSLTSGAGNVAIGHEAGKAISTSNYNTAMGYEALQTMATGNGANTAVGYKALIALPNGGNDNTSIGSNSMLSANNGGADQNTCVGSQAGKTLTTGNKNTFIGNEAASSTFTTGTKCTIVGSESTTSSSGADNQISLGQGITGQADNTAIIGNSDVTAVYMAQDKGAIIYAQNFSLLGSGNQWNALASSDNSNVGFKLYTSTSTQVGYINATQAAGLTLGDGSDETLKILDGIVKIQESSVDGLARLDLVSIVTIADEGTVAVTIGNGGLVMVSETNSGKSGLFYCDYASSTIVQLADPDNYFEVTDTGSNWAIYKGTSTASVTVKNKTGGDKGASVQTINSHQA